MSLPVLIGFAGVLVAAVATGMLAGRCVRQPRTGFIVWTAATLGLTIALAAQSMGFAGGFGPATFRAVQLFALLLAPLWLSWGLVEVAIQNESVRFGVRLISSALTVVAAVILATDPLTAQPFSKAWPLTSVHFGPVSRDALDVVQALAVVVAVAVAGRAAIRASRGSAPPVTAVVPVALAVLITAAQRFPFPAGVVYPLLSMLAAVLVWFAAAAVAEPSRQAAGRGRKGEGVLDSAGKPGDDYRPDGRPESVRPLGDLPGRAAARAVPDGDWGRRPGSPSRPPGPEAGAAESGLPASAPGTAGGMAGGVPAAAAARPYGRILIFTLLDDRAADFDRLADETAEQVRTGEPDTLVYVIHLVPNAPMQRIFYEIYRDRAAFDSHESQPYMQRFVAERRACVLATNMIELRLKYAKVAPLPGPQPAAGPRGPQRPPGPQGPAGPQRSRPLPPSRPQRSDQPRYAERYDQPGYDQPGYDQQWYEQPRADREPYDERRPDPRQVPSGRPYGG